ncbi:MAG: outer membrane protein assembly factor BamD [Desulfuromonadales bacterium]|nr:outer membrane protein assembly factor BamD [Desulfuromonadales bacterium]
MHFLFLASLCLFFMTACSSSIVPPPRSAEILMSEGETFFVENRYDDAIAAWEKVRERYVSPEMNALAELKIAEANFLAERYIEAAVAYEAYLKTHPNDPNTANVLYNLGVSYHREMLAPERDQTTTRNALSAFKTLLSRYPTDPRRPDIEKFIAEEEDTLAGHELHIGSFYQKKGVSSAAISRMEPLITAFPNFSRRDELHFILGSAYLDNNKRELAAEQFNRLYKEYPQSKYIQKAQKLLEEKF